MVHLARHLARQMATRFGPAPVGGRAWKGKGRGGQGVRLALRRQGRNSSRMFGLVPLEARVPRLHADERTILASTFVEGASSGRVARPASER